jgi:hypothetical protein
MVKIVDFCSQAGTLLHGLAPRYPFHVTVLWQLHMTITTCSSIYWSRSIFDRCKSKTKTTISSLCCILQLNFIPYDNTYFK